MNSLWQDFRYAVRRLAATPGFAAIAVLTFALGIGANTAIFTVVYSVLLRPLPYPQPDRIVELAQIYHGQSDEMDVTTPQLRRLREFAQPFQYLAGYTVVGFNLAAGNEAEHVRGLHVSADYFGVLGVRPALGRDFLPEEDAGAGQRVAIISHNLWVRRFGADAGRIGQTISLNGDPFTLIGVMPADFEAMSTGFELDAGTTIDVWAPLALVAKTVGSGENIAVIARMKPGVTPAQVQAQMNLATEDFRKFSPGDMPPQMSMAFLSYRQMVGADVRPYLLVLSGAIGFVLLIACANVANLLLARGALRSREMAIRTALGASRAALFRQLLAESVLLAAAGGAAGLLLARWGLSSLLALAPVDLPRMGEIHLDRWVLAFAIGVSLLTGVLSGLAPGFGATRANLNEVLKESVGRSSAGPRRGRMRQIFVAGELAISVVLLSGTGLLVHTFATLVRTDPGFDPHHVLSMQFWLNGTKYNSTPETANFYQAIIQRLEALPGVRAAGIVAAGLPLERGGNLAAKIGGPNAAEWIGANYREISPSYFNAVGVSLRQGRFFTDSDSDKSNNVAIINEALALRYFPNRSPLGEHLWMSGRLLEIVGVVGDVKSYLDAPSPSTVFIPAAQTFFSISRLFEGWFPRSVVVRTSADPLSLSRAVRDAFAALDPMVPTGQIRSMDQVLARSLALRNFVMVLLSLFAALALVLAGVGLYGVISYAVSQRTREIGVRMALGARRGDVLRLILAEGVKLLSIGMALGLAGAFALLRLLKTMLFGVKPSDPITYVAVVLVLAAVTLAACLVPALRATRIDPIEALRYE